MSLLIDECSKFLILKSEDVPKVYALLNPLYIPSESASLFYIRSTTVSIS